MPGCCAFVVNPRAAWQVTGLDLNVAHEHEQRSSNEEDHEDSHGSAAARRKANRVAPYDTLSDQ